MPRRFNIVRIDLDALAHNLGEVRKLTGPDVKIMAVVKADAYGHGLVPAAKRLVQSGADALGVMDLEEAVRLREAGIGLPVFILAGITPDQCSEILAHDITPFIYDPALARDMNRAAGQAGKKAVVHLKVDTGMNRLGIRHDRVQPFFRNRGRSGKPGRPGALHPFGRWLTRTAIPLRWNRYLDLKKRSKRPGRQACPDFA